jgi:heterodisulfide reductase subunit B
MKFDNPLSPSLFDQLVEVTGAESIPWPRKLECCGSPVWGINDDLSMDLTEKKINSAKESGADYLCIACPYCQLQFDRVQRLHISKRNGFRVLPPILYPQLLGLSMGMDPEALGIDRNELDINGIMAFL